MKFNEFYKLLMESPSMIQLDAKPKRSVADEGIDLQDYSYLGELFSYDLFVQLDDDITRYYLLDKSHTNIILYTSLRKIGKYQTVNSSWKDKDAERGLMTRFFKEFLIPKYHVLESGNLHTKYAKQFWISFIENNLENYSFSFVWNGRETMIDSLASLRVETRHIWGSSDIILRIYEK